MGDFETALRDRSRYSRVDWRQVERDRQIEEGRKQGVAEERDRMRREAIKAGVAEYVIVDALTGRTEFRWKKPFWRDE